MIDAIALAGGAALAGGTALAGGPALGGAAPAGAALSGAALPGAAPGLAAPGQHTSAGKYTVQEIIDLIMREGALTPIEGTVDTMKAGRSDQAVTGIVTTMFATIKVIGEAVERNANFIIAHEPLYYNHRDDAAWASNTAVAKEKKALIEKHGIAIWRFHDYCHALKPDGITYGLVKKADWLSYYKAGDNVLTIPPLTLSEIVEHLKSSLGIAHVRVIGNPDQKCSRVGLLPGAWGGEKQITLADTGHPDVLIVGEVSEWETAEYTRDGRLLNHDMGLIILGHAVSEEPGMEWVAEWLKPKLPGIDITHVPSGNPFMWM